jgi:hypothetical protein
MTSTPGIRVPLAVVAACLAGLFLGGNTAASQVRQLNLEQMTERAETIFVGRCIEVAEESHPALRRVTRATFRVEQPVKGRLGPTVTVRLPGGAIGSGRGLEIAGLPRFAEGERVMLFLYRPSELGLSAPVGLGQGRFEIQRGKSGLELATNDFGNRRLLQGLSSSAKSRLGSAAPTQLQAEKGLSPAALLQMTRALAQRPGTTR